MSSLFGIGGGGNVGASGSFYDYTIDQSLRFDKASSSVLHRTPSSAGNRKTWSFSCWIKRSKLTATSTGQSIFSAGSNVYNRRVDLDIGSDHELTFFMDGRADGASYYSFIADPLLRDTAAWMHIMAVMDTTDSTADDRLKLYVNGERQSGAYQYGNGAPPLNSDWYINSTYEHDIGDGHHNSVTQFWDGYIAEVHHIDGTALDPTSFGETKNGIWVPKQYSGSYGTNGFYLSFADSANIGDDLSGNTNDWTATNLAASDVVTDSPTNSFPVLIPGYNQTTEEGGLKLVRSSSANNHTGCFSSMGVSSGKWYVEIKYVDASIDTVSFGVAETKPGFDPSVDLTAYVATSGISANTHNEFATWLVDARLSSSYANTLTSYGSALTSGDIVQIALDMDNQKIWYGVNGTYIASGDPANGTNASQSGSAFAPTGEVVFVASAYMGRVFGISFNFGQDSANVSSANSDENGIGSFEYAPPSGFLALCTSNLSEPAIGPNSTTTSDEHFNTLLYTGDDTASRAITGVGFAPDWIWLKSRNSASYHHQLHDSVRGASAGALYSSLTNAEDSSYPITSFDSDGFTTKSGTQNGQNTSNTYVAWNWKAGGTAVSNTDGSITSSVSANTDAGFAVGTYTGNATAGATIGHSLGAIPEMVIVKRRDNARDWAVYHKDQSATPTNAYLLLNSTAAIGVGSTAWNNGTFTSDVFTIGSHELVNFSGDSYVFYAFKGIEGYSKVGKFVGNGSADGTFVYTGMAVKWVMIKNATTTGTNWIMFDNKRSTFNVTNDALLASSNAAEYVDNSSFAIDMFSNGFKARSTYGDINQSGNTFIYLAFAEAPFKYSLAR